MNMNSNEAKLALLNSFADVNDLFQKVYHATTDTITFKPEYANGTGYLDGLVTQDLISTGVARGVDDHGRRFIVARTAPSFQTVFFERGDERGRICVNYAVGLKPGQRTTQAPIPTGDTVQPYEFEEENSHADRNFFLDYLTKLQRVH